MNNQIPKPIIIKHSVEEFRKKHSYELKFLINNWSKELLDLKIPTFHAKINITKYVDYFIGLCDGKFCEKTKREFIDIFGKYFEYNTSQFVRLNRRSPKDYKIRCESSEDVYDAISNSMRAFEDLCFLKMANEEAFLYLSEWDYHLDQKEFRCFVKEGKLIGITQYEGTKIKGFPENCIKETQEKIIELSEKVIPTCGIDNFVFDCFFHPYNEECMFLEINPYGMSDPCFFINYNNVEKGGFAYQKTEICKIIEEHKEK